MTRKITVRRKLIGIFLFCGIFFGSAMTASAQNNYYQYSYFIYTIAKFVDWPADYKTGDFIIGVLGESEATPHFKTLAMKKEIAGRKMKIAEFSTIKDISKCNMLFIPEALSGQVPEILKKIKGTAIMMITEKEGLALKGSCVNFISSQGKLAFELNSNAMDEAGLKASKELTKYAIVL